MKKQILFLSCFSILGITAADGATPNPPAARPVASPQIQVDTVKSPAPWTSLTVADPQTQFRFAVMSDRVDGARPGIFEKGVAKLNLLMPDFVINVGDLIQGYTVDTNAINKEWNEIDGFIKQLKMPFFHVPGNHDIQNDVQNRMWDRRFGMKTYWFLYRDVLFVSINSIDSGYGNLTAGQLASIGAILKEHADVRWTFIFMHMPLWDPDYKKEAGWGPMEKLLGARPYTAFAGHYHQYTLQQKNGRDHFTLAVTGGASELRGPLYGEFDHIVWVTMTDKEPVIANVMLDGVQDKYIRTSETRLITDSLLQAGNFSVHPMLFSGNSFTGGTTSFTVRNRLKVPIKVSFTVSEPDPAVTRTFDRSERTVKPLTTMSIPITLGATSAPVTQDRIVGVLQWNAVACTKDSIRVSGTEKVSIARTLTCPKASGAVAIDGKLDDWPSLPYECTSPMQMLGDSSKWKGTADSHYRFGVCYDTTNLYLAVHVVDNAIVTSMKEFTWDVDGIELYLNAGPDSMRFAGTINEGPTVSVIAVNPPGSDKDTARAFPWGLPKGTRYKCVRTKAGYDLEAAVPIVYIQGLQGKNWDGFRLNVTVGDRDPGTARVGLWWRPFNNNLAHPGTGVFIKTE